MPARRRCPPRLRPPIAGAWLRGALLGALLWRCFARLVLVGDRCLSLAPPARPIFRLCPRCCAKDDPLVLRQLRRRRDIPIPTTLRLPPPPTPLARRLEALLGLIVSLGPVEFLLLFVGWVMVRALREVAGAELRARRLVECADDYVAVLVRRERFEEACGLVDRTLARISTNTYLARHVEPASLLRLRNRRRQLLSQSLLQTKLNRAPSGDDLKETASVSTLSESELERSATTSESMQLSSERENRPPGEDITQSSPLRYPTTRLVREPLRLTGRREAFFPR